MKTKVLFFGDSLTYGDNPDINSKFGIGHSFVDILKEKYFNLDIIKEGQGGRTILLEDKTEGRNGLKAFKQFIYSNYYFDYIFIMLGTNDLKNKFNLNEKEIAGQFAEYKHFLEEIKNDDYFNYKNVKVILIAPPKIKENWIPKSWYKDFENTQSKSNNLAKEIIKVSEKLNFDFINASGVKISSLDGIHLDDVGKNIGTEFDGKGELFRRPVYVYKKLSDNSFLGIPMTSKDKIGSWYLKIKFQNNNEKFDGTLVLNQIKNFSNKRIINKIGEIDNTYKSKIKIHLVNLLGLFINLSTEDMS
jgi:mRNA interferase MazF